MATRCQRRAAGRARRRAPVLMDGCRINTPTPERAKGHHCKVESVYYTHKGTKVVRTGWGSLICHAPGSLSDKAAKCKRGMSCVHRAVERHRKDYERLTHTPPDAHANSGPWCHEIARDDGQRTLHRMVTGGTDAYHDIPLTHAKKPYGV